jgi:hypothetical protein
MMKSREKERRRKEQVKFMSLKRKFGMKSLKNHLIPSKNNM